ncbi:hypothetical protein FXF53_12900 [Micromonospora sp. WP24]|uniref:hypothetical protein n=1 Tax=Micromonospora sp. WP24 TaxID=2604469 RepID=UPI0011DC1D2D|nr:hypothetical protein [Micromonospora sp. WP24]TYC00803.1 hypothetical protein FXF53_12900 [Micromonospora sp. WP24]
MTTHFRSVLSGAQPTLLGGLLLAAVTVGTWLAWLSWNTGYRTDPETGAVSGPYAVWQVAGCVLTLAVVAAAGGWWLSPWLVAPVMAVAFTVPWAVQAASSDGSGLWAVGATLVLMGTAAGSGVVSLVTRLLRLRLIGS